ncbi:hypothetical protein AWM75_02365 [Aerococcus urinaehominis]|uniref:Uncharacterized protein n=1 Tax=Aerococcus urinaehominis TaxID=128944 RepID=A0A109RGB8_9LACT|nr:polysaccharide biosynthesis protein [Aerococcus urinaehominis]AMB98906.1 hypothetical protein AWM75_02365 [Aerococcus urinaehominis]SDM61103.1 Peptidoglycan biosynthesis protein MviN/MurJ, putative lipid II flippase [Aerococcus urinaehominis]
MKSNKPATSAQDRMTQGSAWMSIASLLSRILGLLYIIPWMSWMGTPAEANEAHALYNIGYNYYSLFLAVAVAGVPSAIAKQMAYYNGRNDYKTSYRLFKTAIVVMLITGIIAALLLWFLAPVFASGTPARNLADAVAVIRSLVPALAIIPLLSISRGFFQGFQDMKPSAISQITEQIARVIYMLAAVYMIRVMSGGAMVSAVTQSTFAAFIGAVVALITLAFYAWRNRSDYYHPNQASLTSTDQVSSLHLIKEIVIVSIPFIITNSAIEFSKIIDTNTFMPIMTRVSNLSPATLIDQYSAYSANANKLIQVIISLAVAISVTSIPVISNSYAKEKLAPSKGSDEPLKETKQLIFHNMQLFSLIMLPASLGMAVVAEPIYNLVFAYDPLATSYLQISSFMAIILGLFSVLVATLQAMNRNIQAVLGLVVGLILKLLLQYPLLALFGTPGAMYATSIAFLAISIYYLYDMKKLLGIKMSQLVAKTWSIVWVSILMTLVAWLTFKALHFFTGPTNLLGSLLQILVVALVGGWVFLVGTLHYRKLDLLIGNKADQLRKLLVIEGVSDETR